MEEKLCTCSRGKGLDVDQDGDLYCIDCGLTVSQDVAKAASSTTQAEVAALPDEWNEEVPIKITHFDKDKGIVIVQTLSGEGFGDAVITVQLFKQNKEGSEPHPNNR